MSTVTTSGILTGLAGYLASVALAQYNSEGRYLDHPDLPAVLFADADVPDHCLRLAVTGYDPIGRKWDVAMILRAVGAMAVEDAADALFDHFEAVMGEAAWTWDQGTVDTLPTLTWDDLTVTKVDRIARGTVELTSESKHKGPRFTRTDTYRVSAYRQ